MIHFFSFSSSFEPSRTTTTPLELITTFAIITYYTYSHGSKKDRKKKEINVIKTTILITSLLQAGKQMLLLFGVPIVTEFWEKFGTLYS